MALLSTAFINLSWARVKEKMRLEEEKRQKREKEREEAKTFALKTITTSRETQ